MSNFQCMACYLERNLKWHENIIITIIIMNNTVQQQNHPAAIQSLYQSSKAYELCEENIRFQVALSVIFSNACFWNLLCFVMNWDTTSHSSNIYFYKRCNLLFTKQLKYFCNFVLNIKTPFLDIFSLFDGWEINLIFIGAKTYFFGKYCNEIPAQIQLSGSIYDLKLHFHIYMT